jgi:uncharacterized membrane protein YeiH
VNIDTTLNGFLYLLDLFGAFAFAISGASAGIRRGLDVFGVLVLSFVAATFGGIARDLLLGAVPPAAIASIYYLTVSMLAGVATAIWYPVIRKLESPVLVFDAIGLAVFVAVGTEKALEFGVHPVMAAILGMLTGIGGGVMRDLLVAEVPVVLRTDFYALAALAGAAVIVLADAWQLPAGISAILGAGLCLILRLVAMRRGWKLPAVRID